MSRNLNYSELLGRKPVMGITSCQTCGASFDSDSREPEHKFMDGKDCIVRCPKCYWEAYKSWQAELCHLSSTLHSPDEG